MVGATLADRGWVRFPAERATLAWAAAALKCAQQVLSTSSDVWRCGGTWFVGVDALPNAFDGAVGGQPLTGAAVANITAMFGPQSWHRAQISVVRQGYPRPSQEESPAAHHYRLTRDAAHIDGLLPVGPEKRRMIREPHQFILGIALNDADDLASPLTIWEGSHKIMRRAFQAALSPHDPVAWENVDLTEFYQAARKQVFAQCQRITLPSKPGGAVLLDRHLIHGVAPWVEGAKAPPEGRIIAYLRPQFAKAVDWLR